MSARGKLFEWKTAPSSPKIKALILIRAKTKKRIFVRSEILDYCRDKAGRTTLLSLNINIVDKFGLSVNEKGVIEEVTEYY